MKRMKHTPKKLMALGLGTMLIGSAGLAVAQQNDDLPSAGDFEETAYEYGSLNAQEETIWKQIDTIYGQHEQEYNALEEPLDLLYEQIETALEQNNDPEILRIIKEIYAKEKQLEALDGKTGIAKLHGELDGLHEDDHELEDYGKFENSDNPQVQAALKEIQLLEEKVEALEEKNAAQFEPLDKQAEPLFDQLILAEQKPNNQAEIDRIEKELDALDQKYEELENKLGITPLVEQIEALEEKLFALEGN